MQLAGVADVAAEQPGQRQVDLADVGQAGGIAEPAEAFQGGRVQRHRAPWRPAPPSRPVAAPGTARRHAPAGLLSRPSHYLFTRAQPRCRPRPGSRTLAPTRLSRTRIGRRRARTVFAMCGIVGYAGPKSAVDVVVDGLRRLEYRGYDSAGVCAVADGELRLAKRAGKLGQPGEGAGRQPAPGHRVWPSATPAGPPTAARPTSTPTRTRPANGRVALVHNGIIENFALLRAELAEVGITPVSQTDTEVAAQLLGLEVEKGAGLTEALRAVCNRLEGAFTLVAIDAAAARHGGGRPPELAAGGRRRGRGELPGLRRLRLHRAHPRGDRARPGPGRDDHRRRRSR